MDPNDTWEFNVMVAPNPNTRLGKYMAWLEVDSENPLAEAMDAAKLTGYGNSPALAIANLFFKANRQIEEREG